VRAGEHCGIRVLDRQLAELCDDGIETGKPDVLDRALDGQRVRDGVDVFTRAREVGELGDRVETEGGEAVPHEVLDGLDVVTGDGFLLSQPIDLVLTEVAVEAPQALLVGIRQGRGLEQRAIGEGDEPLDLDLDAGAVQSRLREVVAERCDGGAVPAIERAERLDGEGSRGSQGNPPDRAPQFWGDEYCDGVVRR
jgi:hypothetical protein